jgi:hypothetical protein
MEARVACGLGPPDEAHHQLLETVLHGGAYQLDIVVAGHDLKPPAGSHTPSERAEELGMCVDQAVQVGTARLRTGIRAGLGVAQRPDFELQEVEEIAQDHKPQPVAIFSGLIPEVVKEANKSGIAKEVVGVTGPAGPRIGAHR